MKHKKTILAASLLAAALATTGVTLAFLADSTQEVVNTFTPTSVPIYVEEDFKANVKSNVKIKNDGNIPAYIRAAIVVNWADEKGNVLGTPPVDGEDYTMVLDKGWSLYDGYYYWTEPVPADDPNTQEEENVTGVLIQSCTVNNPAPTEGYTLQVEILAQSVQSVPEEAIKDLWGVTIDNDKVQKVTP